MRTAELVGVELTVTPKAAYGALDGLFQQALLGYLCGDEGSLDELADQVRTLMPILVPS